MANIVDIRSTMAAAIAAVTPDYKPQWVFRQAHYHEPLEDQKPLDSPQETTRRFQVWPGIDVRLSESWRTGSGDPYWSQNLFVYIRYQIPKLDDGALKLALFVGSDIPQLYRAIYETDYGTDVIQRYIDLPENEPEIQLIDEDRGVWMVTFEPRIYYTPRT